MKRAGKDSVLYALEGQQGCVVHVPALDDEDAIDYGNMLLGSKLMGVYAPLDAKKESYRVVWSKYGEDFAS